MHEIEPYSHNDDTLHETLNTERIIELAHECIAQYNYPIISSNDPDDLEVAHNPKNALEEDEITDLAKGLELNNVKIEDNKNDLDKKEIETEYIGNCNSVNVECTSLVQNTTTEDDIPQEHNCYDYQIFTKEPVNILAGESKYIAVYICCKQSDENVNIIVEHSKLAKRLNNRLLIVNSLHTLKPEFHIFVTNTSKKRINIPANKIIAKAVVHEIIEKLEVDVNQIDVTNHSSDDETWLNDLDLSKSDLDENQKAILTQLIRKYSCVFSKHPYDLGRLKDFEYDIKLKSDIPVQEKFRPCPHHKREELQKHLDELLEAGIIRESDSNYCSPILVLTKKTGKIRMVTDFRKLNDLIENIPVTMPNIETALDRLYKNKYFTTMDLTSAYYQIPLSEKSCKYTGFAANSTVYEYTCLPQGMKTACQVFSQCILHVLKNLVYRTAIVYLDDISLVAEDFEQGIVRLQEIFERLKQFNLKLSLSKCTFFASSIKFLGFQISREGISTDEDKIKAAKIGLLHVLVKLYNAF